MKVLHVIPAVAARYGGPSTVVLETVRALRDTGHDAVIATTDADGPGRLALPLGRLASIDGLPVFCFPRVASERFKWSPQLAAWLAAHVSDYDVVDIHAVFSHSSLAAGQACRQRGVPYVVRPHGALDPWSLGQRRVGKSALMRLGARALLTGARHVQYTTTEERRLAEQELPWMAPGHVVSLGVDDGYFELREASANDLPTMVVMSRLEQKKGLELLIDAFHAVTGEGPLWTWRLVIAGAGDPAYVARLQDRAGKGPASGRITFPGWVTGSAKLHLLSSAALFASPSEQENFGLSIVEAMASGLPVLITPGVNLAAEVRAAGAGWVVSRDWTTFVERLRAILTDGDALERSGRAARHLASGYRWASSAERLVALYEQVLRPGRPG